MGVNICWILGCVGFLNSDLDGREYAPSYAVGVYESILFIWTIQTPPQTPRHTNHFHFKRACICRHAQLHGHVRINIPRLGCKREADGHSATVPLSLSYRSA